MGGKQKTGKEVTKSGGGGKENVQGKLQGKAPAQLPQADKVIAVSAPVLAPPAIPEDEAFGQGEGEEMSDASLMGLPLKMQLGHVPLLEHPVRISAIQNFMSAEECQRWIDWGEKLGFEEAKQKQTSEMAFRDNGRIEVDSEEIAHNMWLRIRSFVPEQLPGMRALGCSPRIRLYRYVKGQRFGQHVDGSRAELSLGGHTHFTVLVYLNDRDTATTDAEPLKGGETIFWKDHKGNPTTIALSFAPARGYCLFHGHGDECMIHEGAPVEKGIKYVLRSDVVYEGPPPS
mmetsp:Transcript_35710/g.65537  ORF Transcript_35710/g.65537 Transcript_35710/m.65537 type:complete len:287 (-) Transcript_35710:13-873(-)